MSDLVERKNISDLIVAKIKDYIVENELKAGDRLPTEHELADRFGVSRISVREATKALGFLGIIDAAPRRGLTIAKLNMERVSKYLGFHFAVSDFPRDQLIDTRVVIELGGLPRSIERMSMDSQIYQRLNEINCTLRSIYENDDIDEWITHDVAFHRQLLQASGLEPLVAFNELLMVFFQRFRTNINYDVRKVAVEDHQQVIDAMRDQKLELASKHLRRHIEILRSRA